MRRTHPPLKPRSAPSARSPEAGRRSLLGFFKRELDTDLVVRRDEWLEQSGVQRQLEFEGYQLRWVNSERLDINLNDGWNFVTLPHYLWWTKRVRRRHGARNQYLLKRIKSLRAGVAG